MSDSPYGKWEPTDISPSKLKMYKDCPKKVEYRYVRKEKTYTGAASLQGSAAHKVFLEELLDGGVDDIEFLVEMMLDDLNHRLDTEDPRDYKSKLPLTESEKFDALQELKIWGEGLLEAYLKGEDSYGNPLKLPKIKETEIEGCAEVYLPTLDATIRIRGYIDMLFEDGSLGDLKLASDYWKSIWTLAKAITEDQPAMYSKMMGTRKFRYLIVDKKKDNRKQPKSPSVRSIDFVVTDEDMDRLMADLEDFVRSTDVLNNYKNGVFPARPEYNGQTKATAGKPEEQFCGKLCDFKEICWRENFARPILVEEDGVSYESGE